MPIARNTSSSGAPKRSASRLDRMPAITRTAPSRMAMLTESREAIHLPVTNRWQSVGKSLEWHPYRRHTPAPTHFLPLAAICPYFAALTRITWRCIDGPAAPFVGFCGALESNPPASRRDLAMDMDLKDLMEFVQTTA